MPVIAPNFGIPEAFGDALAASLGAAGTFLTLTPCASRDLAPKPPSPAGLAVVPSCAARVAKDASGGRNNGPPPELPVTLNPLSLRGEHWIVRLRSLLLLAAAIMRRGRQLQHHCGLAGNQPRHHHDLAAGKFQRVVMDMRVVHINLAESGHAVLDPGFTEHAES